MNTKVVQNWARWQTLAVIAFMVGFVWLNNTLMLLSCLGIVVSMGVVQLVINLRELSSCGLDRSETVKMRKQIWTIAIGDAVAAGLVFLLH